MSFRPGTVSKILWHFTGGPLWDNITNKQLKTCKPANKSYEALLSILKSEEVRVSNYKEIVKVILPEKRIYNLSERKFEIVKNYHKTIKSAPVCCVADIPLQHISYHANRYGKMAIGFRREAVIKAGFNPVMYTLENSELLNQIYKGYDAVTDLEFVANDISMEAEEIQSELDGLEDNDVVINLDTLSLESSISYLESTQEEILESYSKTLSFIKTFDQDEFDTIYCEREWRSTKNFSFSTDDIAVIILPREQDGFNYYEDFISKTTLPRSICIAAWEDLIEH